MSKEVDKYKVDFKIMGIDKDELQEVFDANLEGESLSQGDLERIVMPSGKTHAWTVPGIEGDEFVESFSGIIIAQKKARSYWKDAYSGGGEPPNCNSKDGRTGVGDPGGLCTDCYLSKWDNDIPPLCTDQRILFILFPESILPYMLVVPPTSIPILRKYNLRLFGLGVKHYGVKTRFSLTPAENPGGIIYSKMKLEIEEQLTPEELLSVKVFNENIQDLILDTQAAPVINEREEGIEILDAEPALEPGEKLRTMPDLKKPLPDLPLSKSPQPREEKKKDDDDDDDWDGVADPFICMDKFMEESNPNYTYFWVTVKALGKTAEEVHDYFQAQSIKDVKKGDLDMYLTQIYRNVKGVLRNEESRNRKNTGNS
jgi:hypothetical protein